MLSNLCHETKTPARIVLFLLDNHSTNRHGTKPSFKGIFLCSKHATKHQRHRVLNLVTNQKNMFHRCHQSPNNLRTVSFKKAMLYPLVKYPPQYLTSLVQQLQQWVITPVGNPLIKLILSYFRLMLKFCPQSEVPLKELQKYIMSQHPSVTFWLL